MTQTIYKYPISATDRSEVVMPIDAQILCVQTQNETPTLWALVDPKATTETRVIETFDTGHPIRLDVGVDRRSIGTYQLYGGSLVFHVFERIS